MDREGESRKGEWIQEAIDYVLSYKGENLLTEPTANILRETEVELARASGYQSNKKIQLAVEARAMDAAMSFYVSLGYVVKNVSKTKSWDLDCVKPGSYLRVEVKGLQDVAGARVVLTRNEVDEASQPNANMELFVVRGIRVEDDESPLGTGGIGHRYQDWNPQLHSLRAAQYLCELTQELGSLVKL